MSDETPRRSRGQQDSKIPTGYRSSRRGSKSLRTAKRAERADQLVTGWNRFTAMLRNVVYVIALALSAVLAIGIVLLLVVSLINGVARWNAQRNAAKVTQGASEQDLKAQENLLLIGSDNGKAVGFLALRVDGNNKQVFGIAIPDGAFIEVPGQGFERVGDSFSAGPETSLVAISNYLTVPFRSYVVVPGQFYRDLLKNLQVAKIAGAIQATNLTDDQRGRLTATLASMTVKGTAFVPLPVKPIKLGNQTYFEPQRAEVADLLKAWWGIDPNKTAEVTRVIVYNGAGVPGIAGDAAQRLIRGGFRVVDTKNADRFNYKTTLVVVQRGPIEKGAEAVKLLGAGTVKEKRTDQNVADLVIIIGKDYKPTK